MYTQVEKPKENKSRAVANLATKSVGHKAALIADNRQTAQKNVQIQRVISKAVFDKKHGPSIPTIQRAVPTQVGGNKPKWVLAQPYNPQGKQTPLTGALNRPNW